MFMCDLKQLQTSPRCKSLTPLTKLTSKSVKITDGDESVYYIIIICRLYLSALITQIMWRRRIFSSPF